MCVQLQCYEGTFRFLAGSFAAKSRVFSRHLDNKKVTNTNSRGGRGNVLKIVLFGKVPLRAKPLPSYIPFLIKKVTFHLKWNAFRTRKTAYLFDCLLMKSICPLPTQLMLIFQRKIQMQILLHVTNVSLRWCYLFFRSFFFSFFRTRLVTRFIDNLDQLWQVVESFPQTMVHYDFTPRNVCIRKQETNEDNERDPFSISNKTCRLSCIYDWEMATVHAPQHDVVEFLAFALPAKSDIATRTNFVRFYQGQLERFSGRTFDSVQFMDVFNAVCCMYALHQLSLKTITHSVTRLPYFERAVQSHMGYLEDLEARNSLEILDNGPSQRPKLTIQRSLTAES